jgi:NitT/TauT family transport system ATP-binding protein
VNDILDSAGRTSTVAATPGVRCDRLGLTVNGHAILRDLDFACRAGEFVALVGPSGCGKTTVLRLIAGLLRPSRGRVLFGHESLWSEAGSRLGFVFQDPTLLPWRNVLANIALPLQLAGVARPKRWPAARRARELVGLGAADERKLPQALSGGMRMRVSLARALVTDPQVLLLDEPFAAVDDILRQLLNERLQSLYLARRWTSLLVTHNVSEAVFLSQRVLILAGQPARIVEEVPVDFGYPRTVHLRGSGEFAGLVAHVGQRLRAAVEASA